MGDEQHSGCMKILRKPLRARREIDDCMGTCTPKERERERRGEKTREKINK